MALAPKDEWLWVLGYGSLMHCASLRRTVSGVDRRDMRPVIVRGFRRLFNLARRHQLQVGATAGQPVAVLNVCEDPSADLAGIAFPVARAHLAGLDRRELYYRRVEGVAAVDFFSREPVAPVCLYRGYTADELAVERPDVFREVALLGFCGLLHGDILPDDKYLTLCLQGAFSWGDGFGAHFMQTTYMADGFTALDVHLNAEEVKRRLGEDIEEYIRTR